MSVTLTATQTGAQNSRNVLGGVEVKTSKTHTGNSNHEEFTPDETVNVIIGVFFDGTANNRYNVNARLSYEKKERGEKLTELEKEAADAYTYWFFGTRKKGGSYDNDHSNISRIEPFYEEKAEDKLVQTRVYIEGAGTTDGSTDNSPFGKGTATDSTGVRAKVKKACREAAEKIKKAADGKKINTLIIDVFGFSRGAAEARNFIHEITQKKGDIEDVIAGMGYANVIKFEQDYGLLGKHLAQKEVEIKNKLDLRYAGLFDTVLSVGFPFEHEGSVKRLKMVDIQKVKFTFHLAAADEHRKNFKLTDIRSSVNSGKGLEKTIPGVHSDIGGGYVHNTSDEVLLMKAGSFLAPIEKEQEFLIEEGFYVKDEIPVKTIEIYNDTEFAGDYTTYKYALEGNKKSVSNEYSFIPLQIMAEFTKTKKVDILVSDVKGDYPIKGDLLTEAKTKLDAYIKGDRKQVNLLNDRKLVRAIRNKYFHWSANYSSIGMAPNIVNGKRTRRIFPG